MFELKKYKIVQEFNGYRKGIIVSFNGKDAEKYKDFIVTAEVVTAPVSTPVVEQEAPAKKVTRRVVKKGKK